MGLQSACLHLRSKRHPLAHRIPHSRPRRNRKGRKPIQRRLRQALKVSRQSNQRTLRKASRRQINHPSSAVFHNLHPTIIPREPMETRMKLGMRKAKVRTQRKGQPQSRLLRLTRRERKRTPEEWWRSA